MARNGNLTSDLREAISKISEVGRLLAPLTSNTFEELSTSSHEVPHVNRPTVNNELSDPQSIAPSRNVNHELQRLFPTLRRSNEQASPSSFRPAEHLTVRGGKKRKRQTRTANANCKKAKPVFKDIVLIPNPKHDRVPTHSARLELERKGLVIHEFPFDREWDGSTLKKKIEEQFPQLEWRLFEYMKACYGELVKPNLAQGVQMTSSLLLKLTGQGAVYIRAVDCLDGEEDDDIDDDFLNAVWEVESLPEGSSSIPENYTAPSTGEAVRQIESSPQEIPSSVTAAVSIPSCNREDFSEGRIIIEDEGSGEGQDVGLCPVVVLADDNTDIETQFDELPTKSMLVHRAQLRQDLIMEFSDPNILNVKLNVTVVDEMGREEIGAGNGVLRDVISEFWKLFFLAATVGAAEKIPCIRHDFQKNEWEAVGRLFVYSFVRLGYLPLQLSPAFITTCLFGDEAVTDDLLLDSFRFYLSSEERATLDECLAGRLSPNDGEILDLLSSFKCYRNPTEGNLKEIILELAHQEIVQKPRYVTHCWSPIFTILKKLIKTPDDLSKLYQERKPTPKKVVQLLEASPASDAEKCCFDHLKRYLKSLEGNISTFLRFVTGSDILNCSTIKVTFSSLDGLTRRPVAHTCGPVLEIPSTYQSYNELVEEFSCILSDKSSLSFNIV